MKSHRKRSRRVKKRKSSRRFGERDLVQTLWKVMRQQAKAHPPLKRLHKRLAEDLPQIDFIRGLKKTPH